MTDAEDERREAGEGDDAGEVDRRPPDDEGERASGADGDPAAHHGEPEAAGEPETDDDVTADDAPEELPGSFPVVALGASAGGLEAFGRLLASLPDRPGIALVVASHLAPGSKSMLPELLGERTAMPVRVVEDGMRVRRDCVHVLPPGFYVTYRAGRLELEPIGGEHPRLSIDRLFRSLAEGLGPRAVGVVLSGTGTDGTLGLEEIKAQGGTTFASDASHARFPGMPRSAVASGAVDHVLPEEAIAERLVELGAFFPDATSSAGLDGDALKRIFTRVARTTGHDFGEYKRGTVRRRVDRRRRALGYTDLAGYVEHVLDDDEEPERLFRDLLIGVTSFFRDAEVWEALAEPLTALVRDRAARDLPVRAWVPACSTGEEAYSVAIVLHEAMARAGVDPRLQIFATDVDPSAVEVARRGLYPASIADDVSSERLRRWFRREEDTFTVDKGLRDRIVFSVHDVTAAPPFSKLDLLSCRNYLIYLEPSLQRRLFPLFHYAMRDDGLLLLGLSEGVGEFDDLFTEVDRRHKIFRRRVGRGRRQLHFPTTPPGFWAAGHAIDARERGPAPLSAQRQLAHHVDAVLLAHHTPPALVVTPRGEIRHVRGRTAPFLELPDGRPSTNLLQMIRASARAKLRAALEEVAREGHRVLLEALPGPLTDPHRLLDVTLEPLDPAQRDDAEVLVLFREHRLELPREASAEDAQVRALESENESLRDALQRIVEELETSNEELTSSNEELVSMNEELQSSNEELETSKEEVQSVNEELESVNEELQHKVRELTRVHDDIENLLESTDVATLFLDHDLRIARFTPGASRVYYIRNTDVGRPIGDLRSTLDYPTLEADAREVLQTLGRVERQVRGEEGTHHQVRVMPYRSGSDHIEGVVITFVDVTALERSRRQTVEALAIAERYREALDASSPVALLDGDGRIVEANERLAELLGTPADALAGTLTILDPRRIDGEALAEAWESLRGGKGWRGELDLAAKDGAERTVEATIAPVRALDESGPGYLALLRDVSEARRIERALRQSEARLRAVFEGSPVGLALLTPEGRVLAANPSLCALLGHAPADLEGTSFAQHAHPDDRATELALLGELRAGSRERVEVEKRLRTRDGRTRLVREAVSVVPGPDGRPVQLIVTVDDITDARRARDRAEAEASLARIGEMAAVIAHELRNALTGIRSAVEVIADRLPEGTAEREAAGEVRSRVASLEGTVRDLLDFARPNAPRRVETALRPLLERVRRDVSTDEIEPTLECPAEATVEADPQLLSSLFYNVAHNAVIAAAETRGTVAVRVDDADPAQVKVAVRDTGKGIPDELHERVFEPFFTTHHRGTGLGLAIAKRIAEAHEGSITIDSDQGGTTVTVTLPRASNQPEGGS
ncbi:MAG TPA: chemotaxis protein CheB [Sandaracinaceae bacterium LLY-WYZ-13_1]|nr:chemotaxis protein CheB [Sandaracinaceae bacterium LLY-WYZ-13_1]